MLGTGTAGMSCTAATISRRPRRSSGMRSCPVMLARKPTEVATGTVASV